MDFQSALLNYKRVAVIGFQIDINEFRVFGSPVLSENEFKLIYTNYIGKRFNHGVFNFSVVNGILYGLLIFMLSSGLTLIFGMMGVLNFAHASFYMLGAYLAFVTSRFLGFWPGLIIAPLLVAALGGLLERYGLRKVHVFGHTAQLILTFGVSYIIGEVVKLIWGKIPVEYVIPRNWILYYSTYPPLDFMPIKVSWWLRHWSCFWAYMY